MSVYRGFVPIADDVLEAARAVGLAIIDQAVTNARRPVSPPRQRRWADIGAVPWQYVLPKSVRVTTEACVMREAHRIASKCRCGSLAIVEIDDAVVVSAPSNFIARVVASAGCYCVTREEQP
jgi:hypothetical protein